jgi:hypothetical protein
MMNEPKKKTHKFELSWFLHGGKKKCNYIIEIQSLGLV